MGSSQSSSSLWRFDSPMIYLFGGIFVILGLITAALIILVCSQRKRRYGGDVEGGDGEKTATVAYDGGDCADVRPKLVVIMAGDDIPTYLATPSEVVNSGCETHVC